MDIQGHLPFEKWSTWQVFHYLSIAAEGNPEDVVVLSQTSG